jgi:hypothetical protein
MAVRKLSLPLFSAKTRASEPDLSTHYLHFIAIVWHDRNQHAFVCESQPLMTFRSRGLPSSCPVCGAPNPLTGEWGAG